MGTFPADKKTEKWPEWNASWPQPTITPQPNFKAKPHGFLPGKANNTY